MTRFQHLCLWVAADARSDYANIIKHKHAYIDASVVGIMSRELLRILTEQMQMEAK